MVALSKKIGAAALGAAAPLAAALIAVRLPTWLAEHRSPVPMIAFVPQTTANDVWEPSHLGALVGMRGSGYQIHWNGPTDQTDVSTQVSLVDQAIRQRRSGIILAPDQPLALMIPAERAIEHNIPIVTVGSPLPLPTSKHLSYVTDDEQCAGRLLAARLGRQLNGSGRIAVIGVNPDVLGLLTRVNALDWELRRTDPHILIVAKQLGSYSEAEAVQATRELLHADPHLDAIVALTLYATAGAYLALQDTGRSKTVLLIGAGQEYSSLYYLWEGRIDSLLVENTYAMGYDAARLLVAETKGAAGGQTIRIPPVLITRENMFDPRYTSMLTHLGATRR